MENAKLSKFSKKKLERLAPVQNKQHKNFRGIFAVAIDCLGKPGGSEEILKVLNEMGKNHRRRGISKRAFMELRGIIVETLSDLCKLDDEGKQAWGDLLDTVYHIIFTNLDDKRLVHSDSNAK